MRESGGRVAPRGLRRAAMAALGAALLAAGCGRSPYPIRPASPVADFAGVLDGHTRDVLAGMIEILDRDAHVDLVIVTVATLGGLPVDRYAHDLYLRWKLGGDTEGRGIIVLVAPNDSIVQITVGPGSDRTLNDRLRQDIIDRTFLPAFARKDFPNGLLEGLRRIAAAFNVNADLSGA